MFLFICLFVYLASMCRPTTGIFSGESRSGLCDLWEEYYRQVRVSADKVVSCLVVDTLPNTLLLQEAFIFTIRDTEHWSPSTREIQVSTLCPLAHTHTRTRAHPALSSLNHTHTNRDTISPFQYTHWFFESLLAWYGISNQDSNLVIYIVCTVYIPDLGCSTCYYHRHACTHAHTHTHTHTHTHIQVAQTKSSTFAMTGILWSVMMRVFRWNTTLRITSPKLMSM